MVGDGPNDDLALCELRQVFVVALAPMPGEQLRERVAGRQASQACNQRGVDVAPRLIWYTDYFAAFDIRPFAGIRTMTIGTRQDPSLGELCGTIGIRHAPMALEQSC